MEFLLTHGQGKSTADGAVKTPRHKNDLDPKGGKCDTILVTLKVKQQTGKVDARDQAVP